MSVADEEYGGRITPLVKGERATKWRGDSIEGIPQSFSDLTVRKIQQTLAVPEKAIGLTLFLGFFDRGAKPCSLYLPQALLAGFAL